VSQRKSTQGRAVYSSALLDHISGERI